MIDSGARQDHTSVLEIVSFLYGLQCSYSRVYGIKYRKVTFLLLRIAGFTIEYDDQKKISSSYLLKDCQLMLEGQRLAELACPLWSWNQHFAGMDVPRLYRK